MDEQRKYFLEMESPSGENGMKIVEMSTKNLDYYLHLVDKAAAGYERINSNFERNSIVDKIVSNSIAWLPVLGWFAPLLFLSGGSKDLERPATFSSNRQDFIRQEAGSIRSNKLVTAESQLKAGSRQQTVHSQDSGGIRPTLLVFVCLFLFFPNLPHDSTTLDSIFYSNYLTLTIEKSSMKRRVHQCSKLHFVVNFKKSV